MKSEIRRFRDLSELSAAAAGSIADLAAASVSRKGRFTIALSGGNTPKELHHLLGTKYREKIPWDSVSVFFGDERFVPPTDKQSNYLMARETLLNLVPIPAQNIHPIPTDSGDAQSSAGLYEKELRSFFRDEATAFDLLLLGMGKEGHTASLFPGSPALDENKRLAVAVDVNAVPPKRITLTYGFLNRSSNVYFLVSGRDKRDALTHVLDDKSNFHDYPAKGIRPATGKLIWWADDQAIQG